MKARLGVALFMASLCARPAVGGWPWDIFPPHLSHVGTIQIQDTQIVLFQSVDVCGEQATNKREAVIQVGKNGVSADGLKLMLSTLTAAKLADRQVMLFANTDLTGPDRICYVGAIQMH